MTARNLAGLYGLAVLEWSDVTSTLDRELGTESGADGPGTQRFWLTTLDPDGSPHVTGVGALWADGAFWFKSGTDARKGRNLARDPRCALSLAAGPYDLVVEGTASIVTDPGTVADLVSRWDAQGWPVSVDETGIGLTAPFSAPSAGPPPWHAFRIAATRATAVLAVEPGGATTWDFEPGS
jgi:hypothetical protein